MRWIVLVILLCVTTIGYAEENRFEVIYRECADRPLYVSGIMGYEIIRDKQTGQKYINFRCENNSTVIKFDEHLVKGWRFIDKEAL